MLSKSDVVSLGFWGFMFLVNSRWSIADGQWYIDNGLKVIDCQMKPELLNCPSAPLRVHYAVTTCPGSSGSSVLRSRMYRDVIEVLLNFQTVVVRLDVGMKI